ncbi:MAG: hypothetical protein FJ276_09770 [Planctomycetes bacterium]|nr:hypothetical protein [Planctomycetota bacterium]
MLHSGSAVLDNHLLSDGKTDMADDANLVPRFIPALAAILLAAEDKKGEPLSHDEVLSTRDNATCIMMTASRSTSRGSQRT